MDKKNTMLLTVIAVATLLVAVVGATFAYFGVTGGDSSATAAVQGSVESVGTVTLSATNADLELVVSDADMSYANRGKTYYAATNEKVTVEAGGQAPAAYTIATATASDETETTYTCTYSLAVTATNSTAPSSNISTDEGWVQFGGTMLTAPNKMTLNAANGYNTTGSFDINSGDTKTLTFEAAIKNVETESGVLAGANFDWTFTFNNFSCDVKGA